MQSVRKKEKKDLQDYLPEGWPEIIQNEARLAGIERGTSIPSIKRVVYEKKVRHKLWAIVWKHIQKNKAMEAQLQQILDPAA